MWRYYRAVMFDRSSHLFVDEWRCPDRVRLGFIAMRDACAATRARLDA